MASFPDGDQQAASMSPDGRYLMTWSHTTTFVSCSDTGEPAGEDPLFERGSINYGLNASTS